MRSLALGAIILAALVTSGEPRNDDPDGLAEQAEGLRPDSPGEALEFRRLQWQDENGFIPDDGLLAGKAQAEMVAWFSTNG